MDIKLPFWVLRRLVRRNPWLLSTSGTVSRSMIFDFLWWEVTIDAKYGLLEEERLRLIKERDEGKA